MALENPETNPHENESENLALAKELAGEYLSDQMLEIESIIRTSKPQADEIYKEYEENLKDFQRQYAIEQTLSLCTKVAGGLAILAVLERKVCER